MQRTRATAAFVAERLNLPLETDDALIEIAHGTWEGRMRDEIAANDPVRYADWRERPAEVAFEDGESLATCSRAGGVSAPRSPSTGRRCSSRTTRSCASR